jgi:parallel beta-helix repeat protein
MLSSRTSARCSGVPALAAGLLLLVACSTAPPAAPDPYRFEPARPKCRGVEVRAGDDLQDAIDEAGPGATLCISGTHRFEEPIIPDDAQKLVGRPGAVLSGATVLENWSELDSTWVIRGIDQGPTVNYDGSFPDLLNPEAEFSDDVFFDGKLLRRVMDKDAVSSGTFFLDYDTNHLYIGDDPDGHVVELAVADGIVAGTADDVRLRNLVIEKSLGRGVTAGSDWLVKESEIRLNATVGIKLRNGGRAIRNHVHHNGQFGFTGAGSNLIVEYNEIAYNNSHRYYNSKGGNWGSGATKFVHTGIDQDPETGLILRGNYSHDNWGDGLWTDIDNIHTVIENNTILRNERNGVKHEISYDAVIRNNRIQDNGASGIFINSSSNVHIFGNELYGNGSGIDLVQQDRGSGDWGPHVLADTKIHDNELGG